MHPLDLFWNLGILSKNFVVKDSYGSGGGRHSVNEFHRSWPGYPLVSALHCVEVDCTELLGEASLN